jgi:hypothetical protein
MAAQNDRAARWQKVGEVPRQNRGRMCRSPTAKTLTQPTRIDCDRRAASSAGAESNGQVADIEDVPT